MKRQVLLLAGGTDSEREVSLAGARSVLDAFGASHRYQVAYHEIGTLDSRGLSKLPGDVIFPVLHGPWGEGGPLQDLLEADGRPYVGSDPTAAHLAIDKVATKRCARGLGIPTLFHEVVAEDQPTPPLEMPVIVKPIDDGSSVDLHLCQTEGEVETARQQGHQRHEHLMIERYHQGRELTVGIVGRTPLPLLEIKPAEGLYSYEAKYVRNDTQYLLSPELREEDQEQIAEMSLLLFRNMGCRHIARVDWIYDRFDGPYLLEVNTMPGFTDHSLVPMAARSIGLDMMSLCESMVEMALAGATHAQAKEEGFTVEGAERVLMAV